MQLKIEPVHQPQRLELVLGELPGEPPRDLVAELCRALGHEPRVELVIAVHRAQAPVAAAPGRA